MFAGFYQVKLVFHVLRHVPSTS